MRNNSFNFTLATFVAGIFGFFLRWLQNLNGFDENGLAIPGAVTAIVFAVYSLVVLLGFAVADRIWLRSLQPKEKGAETFRAPNMIIVIVMWGIAALMAVACLVLMFGSDFARYPGMQRIMGALGIFAALSLPLLLNRKAEGEENSVGAIACLLPVLFCCLWLVTSYRVESENPVLWSYVVEMLAIVAATVGFYYVAAFFYGRAKPGRCLPVLQIAAYLCICTLMDNHATAEKLLFGLVAAAMLALQYVIMFNAGAKETKTKE